VNLISGLILATLVSLALIVVDLIIVLRYTVWAARTFPRWVDFLPLLALALIVASVFTATQATIFVIIVSAPLYLATLALFLATLVRLFRRTQNRQVPAARWRLPKAIGALACAGLVLLSTLRLADLGSFVVSYIPSITTLMQAPAGADLRAASWSHSFAGLVAQLKNDYPFTKYKGINWDALAAEFAPRIATAETQQDAQAYEHALREFAARLHDPHVGVTSDDDALKLAEVGGSYGLTLLPLDDGRLVVSALVADGPASRAGVVVGAEIVSWNGIPATQALGQTSVIWGEFTPGTREGLRLQQARFLSRGPVGATAQLSFRSRGEASPHTVTLAAVAAELDIHSDPGFADLIKAPVQSSVLPSGYGYIRIDYELPTPLGFPDKLVQQAVARFTTAQVPGIIVDVRNNFGGESGLTTGILTPFFAQEQLLHYLGLPNAAKQFQPVTNVPLTIAPAASPYQGRVAVLIDNFSHSSAEDIALLLQRLPNVVVVGMSGSSGGSGIGETDVQLPGGYTFAFPKAQSLDSAFQIQLEGDASGNGGVLPDVRVPLNDATIDALHAGHDPVLERAEAVLREPDAARR
jgi:carboxyl-terminal processing protease